MLGLVPSKPEKFAWNLCAGRLSVVRLECEVAVVASEPNYAKFHGKDFKRTAVAGLRPVEADLSFSWLYLLIILDIPGVETSFGSYVMKR